MVSSRTKKIVKQNPSKSLSSQLFYDIIKNFDIILNYALYIGSFLILDFAGNLCKTSVDLFCSSAFEAIGTISNILLVSYFFLLISICRSIFVKDLKASATRWAFVTISVLIAISLIIFNYFIQKNF